MCLCAAAYSETLVTSAKVLEVTERGFILMVGTEPLAVEDTPETKFWRSMQAGKREDFAKDSTVSVRIKTDSDPPVLREISDVATAKWLDDIRKSAKKGSIAKIDAKFLHLKFEDGTTFAYRITDKSDITLKGKSEAAITDLSVGMVIWVKGRLLPSLDTWVLEISDTAPVTKPTKTSSSGSPTPKPPKLKPLPASGKLEGAILADIPSLRMFDIRQEARTLHITYNLETKFYFAGKLSDRSVLKRDNRVLVTYRRDQAGRLIASKVEVFPPGALQ